MDYQPRPMDGYENQGIEAAIKGVCLHRNPHPEGTLAFADWALGWCDCKASDMKLLASDGEVEDWEVDEAVHARVVARRARNLIVLDIQNEIPDIGDVAVAIGIPVVDPTHWVFSGDAPYLRVGSVNEDYDMGGNMLKQRMYNRKAPARAGNSTPIHWQGNDPEVIARVAELLRDDVFADELTAYREQFFYLANLPPEHIGEHTPSIYGALDRMGMGGFIPVDNRNHALPPDVTSTPVSLRLR